MPPPASPPSHSHSLPSLRHSVDKLKNFDQGSLAHSTSGLAIAGIQNSAFYSAARAAGVALLPSMFMPNLVDMTWSLAMASPDGKLPAVAPFVEEIERRLQAVDPEARIVKFGPTGKHLRLLKEGLDEAKAEYPPGIKSVIDLMTAQEAAKAKELVKRKKIMEKNAKKKLAREGKVKSEQAAV